MPIYAYRCTSCGHAQDVLQKMSDAVLTVCPACNADTYAKQVTAAGFQLKGSGWYVTDFRGGATKPDGEKPVAGTVVPAPPASTASDAKPAAAPAPAPAPASSAPAPAPSSGSST